MIGTGWRRRRARVMNGRRTGWADGGLRARHPEKDEPLFHAEWESRALAITRTMGSAGDLEHRRERGIRAKALPPPSYYASRLVRELDQGARNSAAASMASSTRKSSQGGQAASREAAEAHAEGRRCAARADGGPCERPAAAPARFKAGDRVRTKNFSPTGHTRLPRYARGKMGVVDAVREGFVFPDSNAVGAGREPAMGLHRGVRRRVKSGARAPTRR